MDPTANIKRFRLLMAQHKSGAGSPEDLEEIAELFEAIDDWLTGGGFPPHQWGFADESGYKP